MLIEILNDEVAQVIKEIIKDLNYVYFNIDEVQRVRQVKHLSKSDQYNFLVCPPRLLKN